MVMYTTLNQLIKEKKIINNYMQKTKTKRNHKGQFTSAASYWNKNKSKWLFLFAISFSMAMLINVLGQITLQSIFIEQAQAQDLCGLNVVECESEKKYEYNERVPEPVILAENKRVGELFGVDYLLVEAIMRCEATNPNDGLLDNTIPNLSGESTALGLGQYLIRTWMATESFRKHRYARTDYKATIREMHLDVASGEHYQKWEESRYCWERKYKQLKND